MDTMIFSSWYAWLCRRRDVVPTSDCPWLNDAVDQEINGAWYFEYKTKLQTSTYQIVRVHGSLSQMRFWFGLTSAIVLCDLVCGPSRVRNLSPMIFECQMQLAPSVLLDGILQLHKPGYFNSFFQISNCKITQTSCQAEERSLNYYLVMVLLN